MKGGGYLIMDYPVLRKDPNGKKNVKYVGI